MADENQSTQQPQQPQRGVPGTQAPPVPSAEQIARIRAQQQQQLAQQRAQAQQMAQQLTQQAPADVPVAQVGRQAPRIQANIPMSPPSPMTQAQAQAMAARQAAPSPVAGMTAEQVLAGPMRHEQVRVQYAQPGQPSNQFAQFNAPEQVAKPHVPWYPNRSVGNTIELTDVVITGVPGQGIPGEGNAAAKVVLALFSEVLALRERIEYLEAGGGGGDVEGRLVMLERVLYEQRMGMQSRARSVREQIEMFTQQGMDAEAIVKALSDQSATAEQMVAEGGDQ